MPYLFHTILAMTTNNQREKMTNKEKKEKLIQYMKKEKDLKLYVKDIEELNTKSFSIFLKIAKSLKPINN